MNKLEKIRSIAADIDKIFHTYLTASGEINVFSKDHSRSLLYNINILQLEVNELLKIQNYTDAAILAKKDEKVEAKENPHKEMVSHPDHYKGKKLECIDAMLDVFGKEKVSAFCELNAFKYIWRSDSKGTDVQDKRKAIWYLDKYNELKEKARCFFYPKNGHHYEVLSSVRAKNPSNGEWFDATLYTDGKGTYVRETEDFNNRFVDES